MVKPIKRRLSKAEMRERRKIARTEGYWFTLPDATRDQEGEPFEVRLRRLSLQEKASLNGISQEMQSMVQEKTRALMAVRENYKGKPDSEMIDFIKEDSALSNAVNAVVVAVMIDPPVTLDQAESDANDDLWHIDDLTSDDRWSIFTASTEPSSREAKSLRLFRPESDVPVADMEVDESSETSE